MCIVFIDWSDNFQKVSVPQTVMIRLPALLPATEPIKDFPSSRRNGQALGVSIKSCVWLPTSKAKLVFYGSKSPCPTSYSSMIVKTIINKLLNSKRATTPKNVNKLFGLKFFYLLVQPKCSILGRANYVPCSV